MTALSTGLAEIGLGVGLELAEDHRRDLRRGVLLAGRLDAGVAARSGDDLVRHDRLLLAHLGLLAAHEALDREDRVLRVGHCLALGDGADEPLTTAGERHHRRSRPTTLGVLDDRRLATLQHGHTRVGRAEVDSDCLSHGSCLLPCGYKNLSARLADLRPRATTRGRRTARAGCGNTPASAMNTDSWAGGAHESGKFPERWAGGAHQSGKFPERERAGAHPGQRARPAGRPARAAGAPPVAQEVHVELQLLAAGA